VRTSVRIMTPRPPFGPAPRSVLRRPGAPAPGDACSGR